LGAPWLGAVITLLLHAVDKIKSFIKIRRFKFKGQNCYILKNQNDI
jgi:hypothetical protein